MIAFSSAYCTSGTQKESARDSKEEHTNNLLLLEITYVVKLGNNLVKF